MKKKYIYFQVETCLVDGVLLNNSFVSSHLIYIFELSQKIYLYVM